jgi:hypothetical protein
MRLMPVILPSALKPKRRLAASPVWDIFISAIKTEKPSGSQIKSKRESFSNCIGDNLGQFQLLREEPLIKSE